MLTRSGVRIFAPAVLVAAGLAGCQFEVVMAPLGSSDPVIVENQDKSRSGSLRSPALVSSRKTEPATKASLANHPTVAKAPRITKPQSDGWKRTSRNTERPSRPKIQQVSAQVQPDIFEIPGGGESELNLPPAPAAIFESVGDSKPDVASHQSFDLSQIMQIAGTDNWTVRLAAERVNEARARWDAAKVLWLPSLNAGVGYTKHEGQIQATSGNVVDVSRNSLFVGGGAGLGGAPTAGGAGGPARLMVDLSLADAIFEPRNAHRLLHAEQARHTVAYNNTLMSARLAYFDLMQAQAGLSLAEGTVKEVQQLLDLTKAFVIAGKGSEADTIRVRVELDTRRQAAILANMERDIASAELARLLQLDADKLMPGTILETEALESQELTGLELGDGHEWAWRPPRKPLVETADLASLISEAHAARPETTETQWKVAASEQRVRAEQWRPFIPSLHLGMSSGAFGGGVGDNLDQLDGRGDFDALAVWQIRNLGFGTRAARDEEKSRYRQMVFDNFRVRDRIAAEVTKAASAVRSQGERMSLADENIRNAEKSYAANQTRIRGLVGLPIEALQAVQAVAKARREYLEAVIEFNQAHVRLLWSVGRTMDETADQPAE
jgi:outer membrane protein TolC